MRNISDVIENFLKNILEISEGGEIEVQRSALAEKFQCVPSQINYVISTRFSLDKGFMVESKRGGGGYIRIRKLEIGDERIFYRTLYKIIGDSINQTTGLNIIGRLKSESFIVDKEYDLLRTLISREVITLPLPIRDEIRANMLKAALTVIFSK